jgi:drug/metabolite transporter (DMT)-like permease
LAFWHFLTVAFQSTGVAYTSATRAGFISAATTVMVPFMETFAGERVPLKTWTAAAAATFGTALVVRGKSSDRGRSVTRDAGGHADSVLFGDLLALLGSFARAVFLCRRSKIAPKAPRCKLVVARSVCTLGFVSAWFISERLGILELLLGLFSRVAPVTDTARGARETVRADALETKASSEILGLSWVLSSSRSFWATLFTAIGPGWACSWWQIIARASVPASRATVPMATTPLWGALWASVAMGETADVSAWIGGLTILGSTVLLAPS